MQLSGKRLLVVSNRLPIVVIKDGEQWKVEPSSGGLITALTPVMRENRGIWVGWPGCGPEAPATSLLDEYNAKQDYELKAVVLTAEDVEKFYRGFSNRTIWPLFHDLLSLTACPENSAVSHLILRYKATSPFSNETTSQ